jgi:hypothetical protein
VRGERQGGVLLCKGYCRHGKSRLQVPTLNPNPSPLTPKSYTPQQRIRQGRHCLPSLVPGPRAQGRQPSLCHCLVPLPCAKPCARPKETKRGACQCLYSRTQGNPCRKRQQRKHSLSRTRHCYAATTGFAVGTATISQSGSRLVPFCCTRGRNRAP